MRSILLFLLLFTPISSYSDYKPHEAQSYLQEQWNISIQDSEKIIDAILHHSQEQDIDPYLVMAIIEKESNYQYKAKSPYGSKGLMQIQTSYHQDKLKGRSPLDIYTNIEVGVRILKDCFSRYNTLRGRLYVCYNGKGNKNYLKHITSIQTKLQQLAFF